jgi:signal transduction histidine kinase
MAQKANEANKSKSRFLANMSHDIRTPMNAIIGFCDVLKDENLTDTQQQYINYISTSSNSLLDLINDILDFSKIEAGKLSVELSDTPLRQLLNSIDSMLGQKAREKGLKLSIMTQDNIPDIFYTDGSRLRQCLINLISNSIKFTHEGQITLHVYIRKRNDQPCLCFDIKDTGIGIPEENLKTIFDPFVQASNSEQDVTSGTGLGLAITSRLVNLLHGSVSVKSQMKQGSQFTIELPIIHPRDTGTPSAKQETHTSSERRLKDHHFKGSILLVDDTHSNRFLMKTIFDRLGLV